MKQSCVQAPISVTIILRTKSSLYYTHSFGRKIVLLFEKSRKETAEKHKKKLRILYSKEPALTHKIKSLYESKEYEDIKASTPNKRFQFKLSQNILKTK